MGFQSRFILKSVLLLCASVGTTLNASELEYFGDHVTGEIAYRISTQELMAQSQGQRVRKQRSKKRLHRQCVNQTQNPSAPLVSHLPGEQLRQQSELFNFLPQEMVESALRKPQVATINFLGASSVSPKFGQFAPPDSMGCVGPEQFIVAINGVFRSFNKKTGLPDGALNISPDDFFSSLQQDRGTTDPRIRYDRFSDRWFIIMINGADDGEGDDAANKEKATVEESNRVMFAVSDSGVITSSTIWDFFFIDADGFFLDYPTLGIDKNALYVSGDTFLIDGGEAPDTTLAFVVKKSSLLNGGPIEYTQFNTFDTETQIGVSVEQGVDNADENPKHGYFIGAQFGVGGSLIMRRINNPGSDFPTISGNIEITVPATLQPINVPHKGNNAGVNGELDANDDRLLMGHIRDGKLWTTHNIGVNNEGVSVSDATVSRDGSRWYQIDVSKKEPVLVQVGTLFSATATNVKGARSYWMPSVMTSGQGHMVLGSSVAGSQIFANGVVAGRLATDPLGTLQEPMQYTTAPGAYNPFFDDGSGGGRRWGDYSYTSLDPCDNMTLWSIQEYTNPVDNWGVQVVKLLAPPPAKPIKAKPAVVVDGCSLVDIEITGESKKGSGFYDPGVGFECHLTAQVSDGVVVRSVKYIDPTHIVLTLCTNNASLGNKDVVITNPDGQSVTAKNLFKVISIACA